MPEERGLSPSQRALVRLSAALATRDRSAIRAAMEQAAGAEPGTVDEVLLQAHLFLGFPDALEALLLWREVDGGPAPAATQETPELWAARGEEVCRRVYGANFEKLRNNVSALHPDFDRWMVDGGYGRVLGRAGLDLATRELCIVALLAVWRAPRQLHSHLRGALNAGAVPEAVHEAVEIACGYTDPMFGAEVRALRDRIVEGRRGEVDDASRGRALLEENR